MVEVRVVQPDDWEAARAVRLAALRDAPSAFWGRFEDEVHLPEQRWRDRLADGHNLLAVDEGRPVGQAAGIEVDGRLGCVHLVGMWVAPEVRGRGVGERLVREVCRWAAERGARRIELDVEETNRAARRLYERCGFRPTGRRKPMPGGDRMEIEMARPA